MVETKEFKTWHRLEISRRTGEEMRIEEYVEAAMRPKNIRVEGKENGKWVEIEKQSEN